MPASIRFAAQCFSSEAQSLSRSNTAQLVQGDLVTSMRCFFISRFRQSPTLFRPSPYLRYNETMERIDKAFKTFTWVDIVKPDHSDRVNLQKEFEIQAPDINSLFRKSRRSKISRYDSHAFVVLLYPVYDEKLRILNTAEVDIIVKPHTIVTITDGILPPMKKFVQRMRTDRDVESAATQSPERFIYEMVMTILDEAYLMLDHMDEDVDHIEEGIFNDQEREMVGEISIIRRNITDFRKIMQGQRSTLKYFEQFLCDNTTFVMTLKDTFYGNLISHTTEIWNILEGLKERIEALQETNESLISFRINDTIRVLTIISVTLLPLGVIAGVFGMNAEHTPFSGIDNDFWFFLGVMGLSLLITLYYFRRNGWIR